MEFDTMKSNLNKKEARKETGQGDRIKDIIQAAMDGDARLVASLLAEGADVNTVEQSRGFTCLHIACTNGDADVLDAILDHHARHDDVDFLILSSDPPRLAWQLAMSFGHHDLGEKVHQHTNKSSGGKPTGPRLVR